MIGTPDKLASIENNTNKPVFRRNDSDSKIVKYGDGYIELAKKSRKSKGLKLSKSGKKLSKSENLSQFGAKEAKPNFLNSDTKNAFNCLWLAFTKALIL